MTQQTTRIVIAIDGSAEDERLIQKAMRYIDPATAHVRLLVVVPALEGELSAVQENLKGSWPVTEMQAAIESGMTETARSHAARFELPVEDVIVAYGRPSTEIRKFCASNGVDLAIVGLHRTNANEIGSTTLGLLQRGTCDVTAIRLGESEVGA